MLTSSRMSAPGRGVFCWPIPCSVWTSPKLLKEYTRAAQVQSPSAEDLKNVALNYVLLDDYVDADKWMSRSVQMNEKDPDAWYGLGRIRYTRQRFQDAVDSFQKTLALEPKSVKAENNLGLAYEGLNRTEDAIKAYRRALALAGFQPICGEASE